MGVDPKWGRFPHLSRNVPFSPRLSSLSRFVPVLGLKKDKRGQTGTKRTFRDTFGNAPI